MHLQQYLSHYAFNLLHPHDILHAHAHSGGHDIAQAILFRAASTIRGHKDDHRKLHGGLIDLYNH